MLSLSQIASFVALVDAGSFQKAAEQLGCSQPHVSQQLKKLESQLGIHLVARTGGGPRLTRDGQGFVPHARALLASAARAEQRIRDREFVIAASSNIGVYLAPSLIASFIETHKVRQGFQLRIGTNREALDRAQCGEADIALTEWSEDAQGFDWMPWRRERLVAIVSRHHPFATHARIAKAALLGQPIIGGEPGTGTGRILRNLFGDSMRDLKIGLELGSTAAVKEAVKANLGISIVLESCVREERTSGSLKVLEIEEADIYKSLYALLPKEAPAVSLSRAFVTHIAQV